METKVIDLRSDTVTKPTAAMRAAMAAADVGDDVYGEDPTVNKLERRAAEIFEREAAVFVPTGTMGNQIAIRLHTHHGQEVICEARAHILEWEMAMMAAFAGCVARTVPGAVSYTHLDVYKRQSVIHAEPRRMFCAMVPEKRNGSCSTTPKRLRRALRSWSRTSTPSMRTLPRCTS